MDGTQRSEQLLSLRREQRGLLKSLKALGIEDGVTDPEVIATMKEVYGMLETCRERIAILLLWQKPGRAITKAGKQDLRPVLDASQLLPEPPITPVE